MKLPTCTCTQAHGAVVSERAVSSYLKSSPSQEYSSTSMSASYYCNGSSVTSDSQYPQPHTTAISYENGVSIAEAALTSLRLIDISKSERPTDSS